MTGVQVMPGVGAVTTVDVRAEAGLRRKRVGVGSSSSTSLFAGDSRRRPRWATGSVRLRQCGRGRGGRSGGLAIVGNLGGNYDVGFGDVDLVIHQPLLSHLLVGIPLQ